MARKTIRSIPQQRADMPVQEPEIRAKNFDEVTLGFDLENALLECERCLMCPQPACIEGCPVKIDIPGFISKMLEKNFRGAYDHMTDATQLPAVCGRVCPQEDQCEGVCAVGAGTGLEPVAIGRLERFLGDMAIKEGWQKSAQIEPNRFRVAIVGSGPAGMACAADLAKAGCAVTIYEAFHVPGGVLRYGIPEFRLPKNVVDAEIANLKALGVDIQCNTLVGRLFTIEQMLDDMGYDAVFIGVGAGTPALHGYSGRKSQRRTLGQRVADPLQSDACGRLPKIRHPAWPGQTRGRDRFGQHSHGRHARFATGLEPEQGALHLPTQRDRVPGPQGGAASRSGRRHRVPLADQSCRDSW